MRILALSFIFLSLATPALAESVTVDLGGNEGSFSGRILQLIVIMSVLSLAPSILVMLTSFTRIIVVLSLLRSALGLQQTPPNPVLISLALFLTMFIMQPVFSESYETAIKPYMEEKISEDEAFEKGIIPFRTFMLEHTRGKDLQMFLDMANVEELESPEDTPLRALIPAFMVSELSRAFEIGFLVFIPFLIIDMIVASILMAMGMMMLPPVIVSLPFKIVFFVMVDGWFLIAGSLIKSYGVG